ncbi:MAG: type II toxin-antitoxin system VapC family toxin [Kineosporiaceae bacterium]
MLIPDVNVLVHAHRPEAPGHAGARGRLGEVLGADEPVGVSELALSGFLRIVTNHRVFMDPTPPAQALDFCATVLDAPAAVAVRPGPRHWPLFTRLCEDVSARGNVVLDAFHAALAIENGATWVTTDRGVARFPGLRWIPLPTAPSAPQRGLAGRDRLGRAGHEPDRSST